MNFKLNKDCFILIVAVGLLIIYPSDLVCQDFQIRVATSHFVDCNDGTTPIGDFEVQIRAVGASVPTTANSLQDLTFAIIWDPADGDDLENPCVCPITFPAPSCFSYSNGDVAGGGTGYDQLELVVLGTNPNNGMMFYTLALNSPMNFPADWTVNEWVPIIGFNIIGGSGSTTSSSAIGTESFDIAPAGWYPGSGLAMDPEMTYDFNSFNLEVVAPLFPLDLIAFDAEKIGDKSAILHWTTVDEENTSHFLIERSEDYRSWEGIGTVQAAGESASELRYEYLDKNVFDGRRPIARFYYRLKMTDLDGKYEYSNIEVVQFQGEPFKTQVYAYPNPANQGLHVAFNIPDEVSTPTNMTLYNRLGQMVCDRELPEGTELEFIDLKRYNIETGAYILQVIDADNTIIDQQKIIVQRN